MASLPSYQEATARPYWLDLAAPYLRFGDYRALCLVSRKFWDTFAPRLWGNLLKAARLSGLDAGDDVQWWFDFVYNRLGNVRPATRALVRVLDAREFAKDAYHFSSDQHDRSLHQSFRLALSQFDNLDSILLDGHAELEASLLIGRSKSEHSPILLSIAHWPSQLPNTFFSSPSLQSLVFLDLSNIPGSIWPLVQPGILPELRILKLRGKEIDDAAFCALVQLFRLGLWSLDLSDNRITDGVIDTVGSNCFPTTTLRSEAHARVEGKLVFSATGTSDFGPFVSIEESEWSKSFDHPERFFVDAPMYMAVPDSGPQEYQSFRSGGRTPIRHDSADATVRALSGVDGSLAVHYLRASRGLTHLQLSNNQISASGIEKLLRISNGQLEHLTFDVMPLLPVSNMYAKLWPRSAKLYGILGAAHMFRPVFSSNLRVLKLHHSLVTNMPTVQAEGLSTLACIHLSETSILPRVDQAYPETFVPDMNPRLFSLTLTGIPRRSSGPVMARLINFLKLLSTQERAIQDVTPLSSSWRRPNMLQGLRHLRLEFEPDPMEDGFSTSDDLDAEELMNSGERGFSFFQDERTERSPVRAKPMSDREEPASSSASSETRHIDSGRGEDEAITYNGLWNGGAFSVPVWAGPRESGSNAVINEYRRLVVEQGLRDGVGPATSAQILAGAPEKSYIFHTAWCVAIMPSELKAPATNTLAAMRDVLDELKRYRLTGRARFTDLKKQSGNSGVPLGEPHNFWTGKLEVSTEQSMPHSRSSQYRR